VEGHCRYSLSPTAKSLSVVRDKLRYRGAGRPIEIRVVWQTGSGKRLENRHICSRTGYPVRPIREAKCRFSITEGSISYHSAYWPDDFRTEPCTRTLPARLVVGNY